MSVIKHNVYWDGQVQSLGFVGQGLLGEQDKTVGVLVPGEYDFGVAKRKEMIWVISGHLTINGVKHGRGYQMPDSCTLQPGSAIHIVAEETSSYLCEYD